MYNLNDTITPIDRLGHSYKVMARYYCQSQLSRETWRLHTNDILPVFDYCLVNCDNAQLEHLIITHADQDGIIPNESRVNTIMLDDTLMLMRLIVCHPDKVRTNYSFWNDIIIGDWDSETLVTWKDGILYVCSELVN